MEVHSEPLSPDNTNEESNLKTPPKNNGLEDSINIKTNLITDTSINNINVQIDNLDKVNSSKNVSKISRKTQFKIYIPIVTIKIIVPSFFMLKYIIYSYESVEDQDYCIYSVIILTVFILFCYYLAVFSNSSQTKVDKYFQNPAYYIHKSDGPGNEILNLSSYTWNDCAFCKSKKYMRTSHCRICNKCVLMRDHHCPYIANCVGFKNMQYFFNFVFWGDTGIIFYIISFIYYRFFSDLSNGIPLYAKILMYADVTFSAFFIINITGIMLRLLLMVYNNRTQKESSIGLPVESYCPICYCCTNYPKYHFKREVNYYNTGFLSSFYYIVGPTILHFIFPLPKYNNYLLDENCPVVKKMYHPDRLNLFKCMVKIDPSKINLLEEDDSSPDVYLNNCHKYYDEKKII